MEKDDFIKLLQRSSPTEIREFIEKKGKRKLIDPFIFDINEEGDSNNEHRRES